MCGYIRLYESGELLKTIETLRRCMSNCRLCPRRCEVDRTRGELGVCRTGHLPIVSSYNAHFGEEPPLVGRLGSGTIFMTNCNLKCLFCQNYEISHLGSGEEITVDRLAAMIVSLQRRGCHNINFVTPTHQIAQIVESLPAAIERGLEVPLVYNSGGYESVETLRLARGIFDIYMPDVKYGANSPAAALSDAPDYVERVSAALKEMHSQVGDLVIEGGIARRGLLIRHLVLPGGLAHTREVMEFIAREISKDSYVNIMDQFTPCYKAASIAAYPEMARPISAAEFDEAVGMARDAGITRIAGISA